MGQSAVIVFGANDAYFYRCRTCNALMSILNERKRMRTGDPCQCGGYNYHPSDLRWWEIIRPKVLRVVIVRMLGGFDHSASEIIG